MKKLLMVLAAFIVTATAMAQKADDVMKVNTEKHDFGKIKKDVPVTTYIEIKNISDKPLVVENTWGSCGCTTPEKPEAPILPNTTAKIKVQYNAASMGPFSKDVFIKFAGIEEPKVVKITGEVIDPAAAEAAAKQKAGAAKKS